MNSQQRALMLYAMNLWLTNQLLQKSGLTTVCCSQRALKESWLDTPPTGTHPKAMPMAQTCKLMSLIVEKGSGAPYTVQGYSKLRSKVDDSLWDNRRVAE